MSLREIAEIEKAVKEQQDKENDLKTRMETDYGYWRLKKYDRGKDYKSFTSNQPRTLADLIIDFLVRSKTQIRIPIDKEKGEEREKIANAERLLIGLLKINDLRLGSMVLPSLLEQMAWHSVVRGWLCLRAFITKDSNGATKPYIDVWDKLHTFYNFGDKGGLWVCNTKTITAGQALAEYGVEIKGKKGIVYDFWDDEANSIHIKGMDFVKEPTKHGLDHNPCRIISCGATPPIESEEYTDTVIDVGESWLAANRDLVEPMNEFWSDVLTIFARAAKIPQKFVYNSKLGPKPQLDQSPWRLDKDQAALVPIDKASEQDLLPLVEPVTTKDAVAIGNMMGMRWQEGGVPESVYGQLGFQISGYAISRLQEALQKAMGNSLTAIQKGGDWLLRELLLQFAQGGFKAVKVEGRDSKDNYFGPVDLKPKDVKGDWFPEFRLTPRLPEDEMERYAMARIAHEGEDPLMSNQSILDRILKVQDPDLEEDLKLEEWVAHLPPIRLKRAAVKLIERGRPDLAREILALLSTQQTLPQMGGARPTPEAVQPEFTTGVSPQMMPPEALGRTPIPPEETEPTGGGVA